MEIEKGLLYIIITIILMVTGTYVTYRTIFSNVIQEQLVLLFSMIIIAILILYIRNRVKMELEKYDNK